MKTRILNNWKSSLIGLILLLAGLVVLLMGKCTMTEFIAFLPFCLGLIYVKDSIFKLNG